MNEDLEGQLVRWTGHEWFPGQWFTARIEAPNGWGGWTAEVVDPGNFSDDGRCLQVGQKLPNLRRDLITLLELAAEGKERSDP